MTKNGRGNKMDKDQIYDRQVDFREFRIACCNQAAGFRRGKTLPLSTVFKAELYQTKIGNGHKNPFFIVSWTEEIGILNKNT